MKRRFCLIMALSALMEVPVYAQTFQTISIGGAEVNKFAQEITFTDGVPTLHYSDGTSQTVTDASNLTIGLGYTVELTGSATADNSAALTAFGGKVVDVEVSYELPAATWIPITLPFDMSETQLSEAFGEGTKVAVLESATATNINYSTIASISAGLPYIISTGMDVSGFSVKDVTLKNLATAGTIDASQFKMVGTIPITEVSGSNMLYTTSAGALTSIGTSATINALSAYIEQGISPATAVTFSIDGVTTEIGNVGANGNVSNSSHDAYNLSGQKVDNGYKGIVIKNGKKIIRK